MFLNETLKEIVGEPVAPAPLVVADPYTLNHFIGWLQQHPADRKYNFWDFKGGCLMSQYAAACGGDKIGDYVRACNGIGDTGADIAFEGPHTFGAALQRARALAGGNHAA